MAVELVYETHSTTLDNEAGIATGWLPGTLSEAGRVNASDLGRRRRADGLAMVICSDLARAVETVEIAFVGSDIPVYYDPRLRECNYGALNGAPVAEVLAVRVQHIEVPFPGGGQSYVEVVNAMSALLAELTRDHPGQRVLLVGHSATRFALDLLISGRPLAASLTAPFAWQEGWEYDLP